VTVFFSASFGKNETQNQKETTEIKSGSSRHKLWREREDDKRRETHDATGRGRGRGRGSQHPAASMDRQLALVGFVRFICCMRIAEMAA